MYDKTVRRRRAVLGLLVALSLILLTAYFGEAPSGHLHSVQRVFLTVVSPIEDGANKALKPVRDMFGWFGDTLHAKSQRNALIKQNEKLRQELVNNSLAATQGRQLAGLAHLDGQLSLSDYRPVDGQVISRDPTLWYSTLLINKGTNAGIHYDDPVIDGAGLIGKVTDVVSDGAQVTLITDQSSGVAAQVLGTGDQGMLVPKVGDPNSLLLQYLPNNANVTAGQYIVTAGTVSSTAPSLFPPGIPIGQVTSVNDADIEESVDVRPLADLRQLGVVQVLTQGTRGSGANQITAAVSQLPSAGSEPSSRLPGIQRASTSTSTDAASGATGPSGG